MRWKFRHCFSVPPKATVDDFRIFGDTVGGAFDRLREVSFDEGGSDGGKREICIRGTYDGDPEAYPHEDQVSERTWDVFTEAVCEQLPKLCSDIQHLSSDVEPLAEAEALVSKADLETVNRHRASLGLGPIDVAAGWTPKELRDMARSIRATGRMANPAILKRRLLR